MAEPEDPRPDAAPQPHDDFDDDLVGFASPRALSGASFDRPVSAAPEPQPEPEPEPEPEPSPELEPGTPPLEPAPVVPVAPPEPLAPAPEVPEPLEPVSPVVEPEPDPGFVEPEPMSTPMSAPPPEPEPEPPAEAEMVAIDEPEETAKAEIKAEVSPVSESDLATLSPRPEAAPIPAPSDGEFGQAGATRTFERPTGRREPGITSEGDARLSLAIYACLIAAAFSVGLTAVIALFLAWTGRLLVKGWTRSHLLYQLRTSLIGVIAGIVGVLTLPLGLGVFILSLTVIWVVVRGAAGLIKLLRREEIRDPKTWSLP